MNKDSIIQFVGFITQLDLEVFNTQWEQFARELKTVPGTMVLQQAMKAKSRYKYVSRHEYRDEDFRFDFMKGRTSEHFPDQKVKVEQAGGYVPIQIGTPGHGGNTDLKIMAFTRADETTVDFYRRQSYPGLNIYQAYYESSIYGYILEFFVPEADIPALLQELASKPGVEEVAVYQECLVPHA